MPNNSLKSSGGFLGQTAQQRKTGTWVGRCLVDVVTTRPSQKDKKLFQLYGNLQNVQPDSALHLFELLPKRKRHCGSASGQ